MSSMNVQEILKAIDQSASENTWKIGKMYWGIKDFMTGNYSEKVSGFFNLTIYFIALTGVMNILYFQFFNEINPFIYSAMCVLFPIVATTTVKSSWILSQKIQQFFFNEREIAIIAIGGILTFIISFAA